MNVTKETIDQILIGILIVASIFLIYYVAVNTSYKDEIKTCFVTEKRFIAAYDTIDTHYTYDDKGNINGCYTTTTHHPEQFLLTISDHAFSCTKDNRYFYDRFNVGNVQTFYVVYRLWKNKKVDISDFDLIEK